MIVEIGLNEQMRYIYSNNKRFFCGIPILNITKFIEWLYIYLNYNLFINEKRTVFFLLVKLKFKCIKNGNKYH